MSKKFVRNVRKELLFTEDEFLKIEAIAKCHDEPLGQWCRNALLAVAAVEPLKQQKQIAEQLLSKVIMKSIRQRQLENT